MTEVILTVRGWPTANLKRLQKPRWGERCRERYTDVFGHTHRCQMRRHTLFPHRTDQRNGWSLLWFEDDYMTPEQRLEPIWLGPHIRNKGDDS